MIVSPITCSSPILITPAPNFSTRTYLYLKKQLQIHNLQRTLRGYCLSSVCRPILAEIFRQTGKRTHTHVSFINYAYIQRIQQSFKNYAHTQIRIIQQQIKKYSPRCTLISFLESHEFSFSRSVFRFFRVYQQYLVHLNCKVILIQE